MNKVYSEIFIIIYAPIINRYNPFQSVCQPTMPYKTIA